jgi:RES domain-containing protein
MEAATGTTFRGVAFCHVPADEPIRLDALVSDDGTDDRWNGRGEPTVYLAVEPVTAIAELARHLDLSPADPPVRRRLLGLSLQVEGLLDLRRPDVRQAIEAPDDLDAFRDREVARASARRARSRAGVAGLLVPSMAFLDDLSRANLVLFMEHLGGNLAALVRVQHEAGIIEIRPAAMRG